MSAKLFGLKTPLNNVSNVTSLTLAELRQRLTVLRDLSSLEALEALQVHLIGIMQSTSNCIAEIIFDADVTAIVNDQILKREGKPRSSLHGIPVCLSNCFSVRGEDCNGSIVLNSGSTCSADCALVRNLREVGAIPVALSNTAVLLGEPDSSNRLYGKVVHPTHPDRVVGPTSIAAIVEKRGAFLGFGLDVLGDVRLSAANIGIVGFKPTAQRLSVKGIVRKIGDPELLPPTVGIVGLHVSDITDALEALTSVQVDSSVPPLPFKSDTSTGSLNIGVFTDCSGILSVVPGVERLMSEVKAALKAQGHNVIEVELPDPDEAVVLAFQALIASNSDWNLHIKDHCGSSLSWHEIIRCCLPKLPLFLRRAICSLIQSKYKLESPILKQLLEAWRKPLTEERISKAIEAYRLKFIDLWSDEEIDILVGPAAPAPALLKKTTDILAFLQTGYSAIFNIVNYPAGVVPFSRISKEDVSLATEVKVAPQSIEEQLLRQQQNSEYLPLAVQVAGKPWADSVVLRVMQELENAHPLS